MPKIPPLAPQPTGSSTGTATPGAIAQPGTIQGGAAEVLPNSPMAPPEPTGPDTISQ
nr:hypothetical protein [Glaciimonas sp. PAMC28666]